MGLIQLHQDRGLPLPAKLAQCGAQWQFRAASPGACAKWQIHPVKMTGNLAENWRNQLKASHIGL
jgi:hypothetical protein